MVNKASPILLGFPKAPAQSSEKIMKACHTPFGHKSLDCYERILLFVHNSLFSSSSSANNDDFFSIENNFYQPDKFEQNWVNG